jgi:hypothetical protein
MRYEFNYNEVNRLRLVKGWSWGKLGVRAKLTSSKAIYAVRDGGKMVDGRVIMPTPAVMKSVARALRISIDRLIIETDD